ncbi:MAG: helix-turn-helix transcriptional regulator [Coriobacteriales bacterium]|jgi:DNA-binding CsgD family transcriptional regulator|nr:helix-turn-helix transcriptional regulator [Coriobacteriales bacterium]
MDILDQNQTAHQATAKPLLAVIPLCVFGSVLVVTWLPFASLFAQAYLSNSIRQGGFLTCALLFPSGIVLGAAMFSVLTWLKRPVSESSLILLSILSAACGFSTIAVSMLNTSLHEALCLIGVLLLGCATALLWSCWDQVLIKLAKGSRAVVVACAVTAASILFPLAFLLTFVSVTILSALGTAVSFALLLAVRRKTGVVCPVPSHHVDTALYANAARSLLYRFFIASFCIGLAFGMMGYQFSITTHSKVEVCVWASGIVGAAILIIFLFVGYLISKESDNWLAFKLSGFTAIPAFFPLDPGTRGSLVFAISVTLVSAVVIFGVLSIVRLEISKIVFHRLEFTDSVSHACQWLGVLLGILFGIGCSTVGHLMLFNSSMTMWISLSGLLSIILVVMSTNVLIRSESIRSILLASAGSVPVSLDLNKYKYYEDEYNIVRNIASSKGLTQRETEVLLILAKGNNLQKVQSELFISQGTATTHRNNIYRKLNIHRRQELIDYLDSFR